MPMYEPQADANVTPPVVHECRTIPWWVVAMPTAATSLIAILALTQRPTPMPILQTVTVESQTPLPPVTQTVHSTVTERVTQSTQIHRVVYRTVTVKEPAPAPTPTTVTQTLTVTKPIPRVTEEPCDTPRHHGDHHH